MAENLKIETEIYDNPEPKPDSPLSIKFVITNTSNPQWRDVLFDEVYLKVGVPPDWHVEKFFTLSGGQSITYHHACRYEDINRIQYTVEGMISPTSFFKFWNQASNVNSIKRNLSVKTYLKVFNEIKIHRFLEDILKTEPVPIYTPSTTIADIEARKLALRKATDDFKNDIDYLLYIIRLIKDSEKNDVQEHWQVLGYGGDSQTFINRTTEEWRELQKLIENPKATNIVNVRDSIVNRLRGKALQINQATENLMKKYNISDEDVHYRYRGWTI